MDWIGTLPVWLPVGMAVLLGAMAGGYLDVVASSMVAAITDGHSDGMCVRCGCRPVRRERIPLLSWLLARGGCEHGDELMFARRLRVVAGTSVSFGLLAWMVMQGMVPAAALPAGLVFASYGIVLSLVDIQCHRLPDVIVLPAYPVMSALLVLASWGTGDWYAVVRSLLAGISMFGLFAFLALVNPTGIGGGDVKLAGVIGLFTGWFGWSSVLVAVFASFVVGSVIGLWMVVVLHAGRRAMLPFGPAMVAGSWAGVLWSVIGNP